jgi:segregation and condensation protein B
LQNERDIKESLKTEIPEDRLSDLLESESVTATEALLFASPQPLSDREIGRIIGRDRRKVASIIEELNQNYIKWGRSFRIERFGGKYRFFTLPEFDRYISRLAEIPRPVRLSRAALEVLSIVAYKQPVVKAEIERIRGVNPDAVIRTLLEKGLIEVHSRSDGPGRPLLYRTTRDFLEFFGICDLSELPVPEMTTDKGSDRRLVLKRPAEEIQSAALADETE